MPSEFTSLLLFIATGFWELVEVDRIGVGDFGFDGIGEVCLGNDGCLGEGFCCDEEVSCGEGGCICEECGF